MGRPDPLLNMFKEQDFMPLLLPRADIGPLQVVGKSGKTLRPMGPLSDVMVAGASPLPSVAPDIVTAARIEGQRSSKVAINIGLNLLGNLLQAVAGVKFDIEQTYQKAKSVVFEFADVTLDKVDLTKLDAFLGQATIQPAMTHLRTMMLNDEIGVINAALKSKKFFVTAQSESGSDLKVQVPVLKGVAAGNLHVTAANAPQTKLAYEGATAVTFAAQAVQLFFTPAGAFTAFDPFETGEHAIRGREESPGLKRPKMMSVKGAFAEFETAKGAGK